MTIQEQLKAAEAQLSSRLAELQGLHAKIKDEKTKDDEKPALRTQFDNCHSAMQADQHEFDVLKSMVEAERSQHWLSEPQNQLQTRAPAHRERNAYERERRMAAEVQVATNPPGSIASIEAQRYLDQHSLSQEEIKERELHNAAYREFLRAAPGSNAWTEAKQYLEQQGMAPKEANALLGTVDDLGGFTVPEDFRAEVLKNEAGFTAVRMAGARVVPTSGSELVYPTLSAGTDPYSTDLTAGNAQAAGTSGTNWKPQGYVTGGTAPATQNKPTWGQARIPVHPWQPDAIEITRELLDDSAAPIDSIIAEAIGETKGLDEDWAFLNGDSVQKPRGILFGAGGSNPQDVAVVNSGSASALTYGGIINLTYTLPAQYRNGGAFIMASLTMAALLKLETSTGVTLIFPPNGPTPNVNPNNLLGRPVFYSEFMPAVGANNMAIIFGAFRHYIIAERTELRIQRLTERYAPNVGILPYARFGGQVTRKDAFRIQKVAA